MLSHAILLHSPYYACWQHLCPMCLPAGLCNAEALEQTLTTIDNNNLARLAGVNRAGVQAT